MVSFARFIWMHIAQRAAAPGGLGGECVDLVNLYLAQVVGVPPVRANAVDWATATVGDWLWETNGPRNFPAPGAIVVWRSDAFAGIGPNGHLAVSVLADAMNLATFEQNWPTGSPCRVGAHTYTGVLGWHRSPDR